MIAFDRRIETAFEHVRDRPLADRLFYTASEVGNHSAVWHALNLLQATRRRDFRSFLAICAALAVESALVNGPIKMAFRRDRPTYDGDRPHVLRKPKTSSFPSGHATSALCAASLLSHADGRRRPAYYLLALVVSISRIHVKIHHASDVVAGAVVGTAIGMLAKRLAFGSRSEEPVEF